MKPSLWLACCAVAGSALGPAAWAQPQLAASPAPPPATLSVSEPITTLAAAFESAWQRAVSARESDGQRQRAAAERSAANSLWAAPPALELNHRNDRFNSAGGRHETEVGLAWPLWLPGQRAARGAAAQAGMALADSALGAARLRLAGEVREAAWALLAQRADLAQADALVQTLAALRDDVQRRVNAGDLARADALAASAESWAATALQTEARQRLLSAQTRWQLLTGVAALPDAAKDTTPSGTVEHPEVQLAALASELARKRLHLVQVSRREPPELTLRYRQDVPGRAEAAQNSIGIGLRLPLATDDRYQPLLAAALSELDVARAQQERLQSRLAADLAEARAALQAAGQQLSAERTRAGLLQERADLIAKSFRAGETPLPDLLRALAAAAQADAAAARQQTSMGLSRARLHQALGLLP